MKGKEIGQRLWCLVGDAGLSFCSDSAERDRQRKWGKAHKKAGGVGLSALSCGSQGRKVSGNERVKS